MNFDIVFVADDKYIKFTAVLMTSIIKNTQGGGGFKPEISFSYHQ
ncbi:hypothetical protein [Campylobacter sp. MIT 99-7217]|nr:hypothetical protein [Campylobacter sp. MIT 99-7217]